MHSPVEGGNMTRVRDGKKDAIVRGSESKVSRDPHLARDVGGQASVQSLAGQTGCSVCRTTLGCFHYRPLTGSHASINQ